MIPPVRCEGIDLALLIFWLARSKALCCRFGPWNDCDGILVRALGGTSVGSGVEHAEARTWLYEESFEGNEHSGYASGHSLLEPSAIGLDG